MKSKLWNIQFISLFLINTLNAFGFYMTMSILSKYLTSIGITIAMAGIVVGMFSITSLVVRPFCGAVSDRLNKSFLLLIALILETIGVAGYALAVNVVIMIIFRIINGIGFCIVSTSLIALATKYIPSSNIGEGIGYLGVSQVIASAVAPGIGIEIADAVGYRSVFVISSVFTIVAIGIVILLKNKLNEKEEKKICKKFEKLSLKTIVATDVLGFTTVSAAYSFINGIITTYLLLFAEERSILGIGSYYTVCAVCLFIFKPFSGKLVDKKGIKYAVYPALLITVLSMIMLGKATGIEMIIISGVLRSIGQGTAMPALQAECIKKVGQERSGVATSTYYLGGDIAQGIGPMIGGSLVTIIGYEYLFDICGLILLFMIAVFYFVERKEIIYE